MNLLWGKLSIILQIMQFIQVFCTLLLKFSHNQWNIQTSLTEFLLLKVSNIDKCFIYQITHVFLWEKKNHVQFLELKGKKILFSLWCMSIVNIYLRLPNIFSLSWYSHQHYQEVHVHHRKNAQTTDKMFKTPYFECISCQICTRWV